MATTDESTMTAKEHKRDSIRLSREATTIGERRALIRMALSFRLEQRTGEAHCCCCFRPFRVVRHGHN